MRDILLSSSSDEEAFRRGESTVLRRDNTAFEYISRHALQPIATFFLAACQNLHLPPSSGPSAAVPRVSFGLHVSFCLQYRFAETMILLKTRMSQRGGE